MSDESKNITENGDKKRKKLRFQLDHSAKFYPIMSTKKAQSLFRISALMKEDVDRDKLQIALNDVLPRFEAYSVRLKKGMPGTFSSITTRLAKFLTRARF